MDSRPAPPLRTPWRRKPQHNIQVILVLGIEGSRHAWVEALLRAAQKTMSRYFVDLSLVR